MEGPKNAENWVKYTQKQEYILSFAPVFDHVKKLIKLLPHDANIIDVGCGHAHYVDSILDNRPDILYAGIDTSNTLIDVAKKNTRDRTHFFLDLSTGKDKYDILISMMTLFHIYDIKGFMQSFYYLLSEQKKFYFIVRNPHKIGEILGSIQPKHIISSSNISLTKIYIEYWKELDDVRIHTNIYTHSMQDYITAIGSVFGDTFTHGVIDNTKGQVYFFTNL